MAAESSKQNDLVQDARPLRVVAMGGGTGLSTLLKGLKRHVKPPGETLPAAGAGAISELSAVVTVTDDGGSSGRLRREFNMLPPGDIRNCIVALSEDEALLSRLFQYRFASGQGLEGHNFGNLFVAALTAVTGDFAEAVKLSSEVLATRGHIYPATTANVALEALMADGSRVQGETRITASTGRIVDLHIVPADPKPLPQALEAIARADLITIGPGSLFTSLIPNLLVQGVPQAIARSPGVKVFVCNLMTQSNESLGLSAADHIKAIYKHTSGRRIFDYALLNCAPASEALKAKYALEGAAQIVNDLDEIEQLGVRSVEGNYLDETAEVARHATHRAAHDLLTLAAGREPSAQADASTGTNATRPEHAKIAH
jgi:uncharacterized cofD-like protein